MISARGTNSHRDHQGTRTHLIISIGYGLVDFQPILQSFFSSKIHLVFDFGLQDLQKSVTPAQPSNGHQFWLDIFWIRTFTFMFFL